MNRIEDCLSRAVLAARRGHFVWGQQDCLMSLADYALDLTGIDPAKGWRGSYADEAGALAILDAAGGVEAHMDACLLPCGWRRVEAFEAGDIVTFEAGGKDIGGIYDGKRILVRLMNGAAQLNLAPRMGWRFGEAG